MFDTDLNGLWEKCKHNNILHLVILFLVCWILYTMLTKYSNISNSKNNAFNNTRNNMNMNMNMNMNNNNPKLDDIIIRNMIKLPNSNPSSLTTSMVVPHKIAKDEDLKKTRMDILNMFYNSFDDDATTINSRPQKLYIIP